MSGSFQRQVEFRILHHLHTQLHFGKGPVSTDRMFDWFCKGTNISGDRFDDAFSSLATYGYFVESDQDGAKKWRLSPFGIDWVEDYYVFSQKDPTTESLSYSPRFSGTIMIGTRREKYLNDLAAQDTGNRVAVDIQSSAHWTRSGAIAGWIAVIVALIAILVALILAN